MEDPLKTVNTQMADPNEEPTEPQPAATVLLVRDCKGGGVEVFLVERASKANFGGAFVFPGGKVDLEDASDDLEKLCKGPGDIESSKIVGGPNSKVNNINLNARILIEGNKWELSGSSG